jgi:4,5-DOPA dioxygenase extradiol
MSFLPQRTSGKKPDTSLKLEQRTRSPGQSSVLLQVEKARKQFGGVVAVNNVSFDVLAREIVASLKAAGIPTVAEERRGLDHGAWVPLLHAYPGADIPVIEVTLPSPRRPSDVLVLGQALAPLRDRGVLLVGSGGVVHNLRRVQFGDKNAAIEPWAQAFDDWVRGRLETLDSVGIGDYRRVAPEAAASVPTTEHFDPIFMVLGASAEGDRVRDVHEGFQYGTLSMRTFVLSGSASKKP